MLALGGDALRVVLALTAAWAVVVTKGPVARCSAPNRRRQAPGAFTALSGLGTAVGSAAGGAIATAVGYGATFLVAVFVVVAGAGLSLLAWRRDHSPG